jgi:DNA-binding NarL/FixJ family response regulator
VLPDTASTNLGVIHILYPVAAALAGSPRETTAFETDGLAKLTPRELEVLRLIAAGRNTAEVAAELFVGVATVRHHSQSILRKLGVHSRLQAAAVFHEASSR